MNEVLNNIILMRKERGFSQENMADFLNMTQSGYSAIESGKRELKVVTIQQIAIIFKCNAIDILTYPKKYINPDDISINTGVKAFLQLELNSNKKNEVFKLMFGENNLEIFNK